MFCICIHVRRVWIIFFSYSFSQTFTEQNLLTGHCAFMNIKVYSVGNGASFSIERDLRLQGKNGNSQVAPKLLLSG